MSFNSVFFAPLLDLVLHHLTRPTRLLLNISTCSSSPFRLYHRSASPTGQEVGSSLTWEARTAVR